jgi:hypothetical protein
LNAFFGSMTNDETDPRWIAGNLDNDNEAIRSESRRKRIRRRACFAAA